MKYLRTARIVLPDDADVSRHEVGLLRGLLECAGGRRDPLQHPSERESVNNNLAKLGNLFGVEVEQPVLFRGFREPQFGRVDVEGLNALIGFRKEVHEILPAVVNALPYDSVLAASLAR